MTDWKISMQPILHPKFIIDPQGKKTEVILPWQEYVEILEYFGLDLDEEARANLREARLDRENGNENIYVDLDTL